MPSTHPPYGAPRLPRGPVDREAAAQPYLDEAFERLRTVLAGRQKTALPGVSEQYLSAVLHRKTPASLERFVLLVTTALNRSERAFVLGALVEDAPVPHQAPLLEVAEATEATGDALACAQRILAGPSISPRELEDLKRKVHRAERELEDVEYVIRGAK